MNMRDIAQARALLAGDKLCIDLLWENSDISNLTIRSSNQSIYLAVPNLSQYDLVVIEHISDDYLIGVNILSSALMKYWAADINIADGEARYSRLVHIGAGESGMDMIMFENVSVEGGDLHCVPARIYGIKGIVKTAVDVLSTFNLNGSPLTFENDMTWTDYCDSAYNFKAFDSIALYYDDQNVYDRAGNIIKDDSGNTVSPQDKINAGGYYIKE